MIMTAAQVQKLSIGIGMRYNQESQDINVYKYVTCTLTLSDGLLHGVPAPLLFGCSFRKSNCRFRFSNFVHRDSGVYHDLRSSVTLRPASDATAQTVAVMARSVIAPMYFWPTANNCWSRVIMAAAYVHAVLLNPDSGPGQQQLQLFVDVVNASQSAGMKVLGYVDSAYGNKDINDIAQEFDAYSSWYGVDGFFVDDMYHWGKSYHKRRNRHHTCVLPDL